MEVLPVSYMPGDPMLIDKIVYELKSQGIFDSFRRECISDVDTKPAYQNLRQRVESSVTGFLRKQKWNPDMNKNHVREMLRKHIHESGYLETGVERIVDQVVNPKMNTVFLPKVTEVVYKYLGIERPNTIIEKPMRNLNLSVENLLPQDLEAVSPESGTADKSDDKFDGLDDSKMDEDESPPFEPIEEPILQEENSVDSHLSGFSGLVSHDSNHSDGQRPLQIDMDTQMSKPSSDGRSSTLIDDLTSKIDLGDDSRNDSNSKGFEENSNSKFDVSKEKKEHKRDDKDRKDRDRHKSDRHRSKSDSHDKKDDRKSERDKKDKYSSRDKDKNKDKSSSSKSRSDREKSDKDKYKSSSSRHSSGSRDKTSSRKDKDRGDHRDKDKSRSEKDKAVRDKSRDDKNRSSSTSKSDSKNKKSSSSSSSKRDKDKKDSKKRDKDDHFSSKHRPERRSTDRDSNDGSGLKSSSSSYCESNSSSQNSTTQNKNQEVSNSNSNDSGNSDAVEGMQPVLLDAKDLNNSGEILLGNQEHRVKLIIPKIASNIHEARRLMKIRKQLKKIEKQRDKEIQKAEKKQHSEIVESEKIVKTPEEVTPEIVIPPSTSISVSMATWDALEAKLNETINYDTYYDPDEVEVKLEPTTSKIQEVEEELNSKGSFEDELDPKPIIVSNESTIQEIIPAPQEIKNEVTKDEFIESIEVKKDSEEDFLYFLPESPKKEETCIKYLSDCMNKLQKEIEEVQAKIALSLSNNIPTTDSKELNKENKRAGIKRKVVEKSIPISKIRNNNNVIQAHDEKFSLPLSPAESDTSLDKKMETEVQQIQPKPKRRINVKKRYSSEDLYKPRPVINRRSTRRRGAEVD